MNCWVQCKRWKSTGRFNATAVSRQQIGRWVSHQRLQDDNLLRQVTMQSMENNLYLDVRQSVWKVHRFFVVAFCRAFFYGFPTRLGRFLIFRWFSHLKLVNILFKPNIFMASSELCQAASSIIGPLYLDHLFLSTPKCAWKHGSRFHWWCDRFHETCNPHKTHTTQHTNRWCNRLYKTAFNLTMTYINIYPKKTSPTSRTSSNFFLGATLGPFAKEGSFKGDSEAWSKEWVDKNMIRMMIDI